MIMKRFLKNIKKALQAPRFFSDDVIAYIDNSWSFEDRSHLSGWVICKNGRPGQVEICMEGQWIPITQWHPRPDVAQCYPQFTDGMCGFIVSLDHSQNQEVTLKVNSHGKSFYNRANIVSPQSKPAEQLEPTEGSYDKFRRMVNEGNLRVLEIGSRVVSPGSSSHRRLFPDASSYVGFDYYPDDNTDVVGDAHKLSRYFEPESFDAVFSLVVFEHLAMPWVVAAEINKVLKKGGITYHIAPQSWPVHEEPWDYWRYTDHAFRVLFSPPMGFEVIEAKMSNPVRMFSEELSPNLISLQTAPGFAYSEILARKITDIDCQRACWDYSLEEILEKGNVYPEPSKK